MARLGKSVPRPPAAAVVDSNAVTLGVASVMDRGRVITREERLGLIEVGCAWACSVEVQVGAALVELMMLVAGLWGASGGAGDEAEEEVYGEEAAAAAEVKLSAAVAGGAAALRVGIASRDDLLVPVVVVADVAAAAAASAPCWDDADEVAGRGR